MIALSSQRTINLLHKKKRGYCNLSESEVLAKPYPQIRTAHACGVSVSLIIHVSVWNLRDFRFKN